ncbi:hypothetical protein P7K49_014383 [Saguinus oedipus]|uniref:Uncharacterized protein n=1 Tax=Saguinus oedipus TaxID=9490 RepID=A0ABQ9VIM0_SAGOE|nr:hypothetical protein P7K49_014383 [Saguinus oedipus]
MECVYTGSDGRADGRSCLSSLQASAKLPSPDPHHTRFPTFAGFTALPRAGQILWELPARTPHAEDPLWAALGRSRVGSVGVPTPQRAMPGIGAPAEGVAYLSSLTSQDLIREAHKKVPS